MVYDTMSEYSGNIVPPSSAISTGTTALWAGTRMRLTEIATAASATKKITVRREILSDNRPIGHCNTMAPIMGATRKIAVRLSDRSISVAYTAPNPSRMPTEVPPMNEPTTPVGTILISSRTVTLPGVSTRGALVVAASVIGTNDIDTRTDETINNRKLFGSANAMRY